MRIFFIRILYKILITLFFCCYSLDAFSIYFRHIGVKEGLSQLSVHSIHQDRLGRMWFGTMQGISIYDGGQMINYTGEDFYSKLNLIISTIYTIVEDENGDIFFLADYNHLIKYDFLHQKFSLIASNITALSNISGNIYAASQGQILIWNNSTNEMELLENIPLRNKINKIHKDKRGTFWLGTDSGLFIQNKDKSLSCVIADKEVASIYEDSKENIWIGTRYEGMCLFNKERELTQFPYKYKGRGIYCDQVRAFLEDSEGYVWIATYDGLVKYNALSKETHTYFKDYLPSSLTHSSIFSLYKDRQGIIWIGTYYGGVNYFNSENNSFSYFSDNPYRNDCLNFPFVGNMVEDKNQNIWICTEGGGLNLLNRKTNQFKYFTSNTSDHSINHNTLKCIKYDSTYNKLYIGTYTGGIVEFNISTEKFRNYLKESLSNQISHKRIIQIVLHKNNIAFLDENGLFILDPLTGQTKPLINDIDPSKFKGLDFIIDSKENVWICNNSTIKRISLKNNADADIFPLGKNGLGGFPVLKILETQKGDIFFASDGSGVYRFNEHNKSFTVYSAEKNELLSNYCYDLAESKDGCIMVTGNKGLSVLDPQRGLIKFSTIGKQLPFSAINKGCGILVTSTNDIFLGSADGLITFSDKDLQHFNKRYELFFSDLDVNNKRIEPLDESGILSESLAFTKSLSLNHKQNNLVFTFSSSDYANNFSSPLYEYKLEGFDDKWVTTNKTSISYTNLNPGKYTLKVKEKITHLNTPPKEIAISILIHTPFYKSIWAIIIYTLFLGSLIFAFIFIRQKQIRMQAALEYERKEKEQIKTLNKSKISFFMNLSHEFRTPLTLIIAQVEMLLNENSLSKMVYEKVSKIYNNALYLLDLASELLDFQRYEEGKIHIHSEARDLIPFIRDIYKDFEIQAQSKHIKYEFTSTINTAICQFDPKQMKKVFYNLLSNAFKYTSVNGNIHLFITRDSDHVEIKVIDNGIGIDAKDLKNIFELYYQCVGNNLNATNPSMSTGIGLTLTKSIIEMHQGSLTVQSKLGYGSVFTVRLNLDSKMSRIDLSHQIIEYKTNDLVSDFILEKNYIPSENKSLQKEFTILIIEDNVELLQLLFSAFSSIYHVILAENGEDGLAKIANYKPDLILTDIFLPGINGIDVCFKLKNNLATSHIPIIIITAQTSDELYLEGLKNGVDDYIIKPFSIKALMIKCSNLLRKSLQLKKTYYQITDNNSDRLFLKQIDELIEKNISDESFNVNLIIESLAMSKSTFYRKFKLVTGTTINEHIVKYKLEKAASLLQTKMDLPINEIADMLGFSSPKYFSKCFKDHFNISPLDYRKSK